ncbi:cbb3-type cytochrome oxidase assembly protein CcoS [Zhongshania sp. BJYM1]|uniref:cbb3-type cytochrome oxidase assembly protein CcoS n=1 Tax=Zhongshania aquatica TaxID=2965069 RepID=UPI0022B57309|nr:cbb3-type cytochrome oxidase assembly protein CcoS [Marortus sp. BJYM1]
MGSLVILLPIALVFFGLVIFLFWWSVGNEQFEDLDREGQRILFDDETQPNKPKPKKKLKRDTHHDA